MTHRYPRFEELNITPDYLAIDIPAVLRRAGWLAEKAPARPVLDRKPRAEPVVQTTEYMGVSRRYSGFSANYKGADGKWTRGAVRPTQEEAAWDYARAMGRDYLERRKG